MPQPSEHELDVFNAALELPAAERGAYLDQTCAGNAVLRQRVEQLLQADNESGDFLETPVVACSGPVEASHLAAVPAEQAGDRIGRYKLLQQIGEGGCGVVYMAEQERPVWRRVALKVIKLGMDTRSVIARFEAERQALALMDHPNIAKVLEAGATETGRPYFVMELVRGIKITEYCDQNNLSTPERLDLFIQVCRAIQHAHQKGIIHRDIKPSNILVTMSDGVPLPKVIDFGIAKATHGRLTDQTLFTAFEQFLGTPAYMSPEQAEMSALDIDTRSDIYSLGVLLYELLTGQTPFDAKKLLCAGLDEIRRTIREDEPVQPSAKLSTMTAADLTTAARRRSCEPPKLISLLRGDLDWIVMKALEKNRARRYETANGLAADVQRHLGNEPIIARPPSNLYRFQKMARRNRVAFFSTAAVALALIIGITISALQVIRATRAEREQRILREEAQFQETIAKTETAKSQQVAHFLKEMLNSVGPSVALGRDTTMLREILDDAAQRVGQDLKGQPDVGADMRSTIGEVYFALGKYEVAEAMQREAITIRRALSGTNDQLELAQSLDDLGVALEAQSKAAQAIDAERQALATRRKFLGNKNLDVAKSLSHLGNALSADREFREAETTLREAVAMQRALALSRDENLDLAQSLTILANILNKDGKEEEAETISREALAIRRKLLGAEAPALAASCQNLANILRHERKFPEAEDLYREALDLRRKLLGDDHPLVVQSMGNLVTLFKQQNKSAEIVSLYRKLADLGNAEAQGRLGWIYATGTDVTKDPVEALKLCRKAAEHGNANGELNLGLLYRLGWGVRTNPVEAFKWCRKAAEQGDTFGELQMGEYYECAIGVEKDPVEAAKWFHKAAEQGNPVGEWQMGECYENGRGVGKNLAEAAAWYLKSAQRANLAAQVKMAWLLSNGIGGPKDAEGAAEWRHKTAKETNAFILNISAWNLATGALRDGPVAVFMAERAVALTDRKDDNILDTLAAAYAETTEFAKAVDTEKEAIALCKNAAEAEVYRTHLRLYEKNSRL